MTTNGQQPARVRGVCPVCGNHHPFARLFCSPECRRVDLNARVREWQRQHRASRRKSEELDEPG